MDRDSSGDGQTGYVHFSLDKTSVFGILGHTLPIGLPIAKREAD